MVNLRPNLRPPSSTNFAFRRLTMPWRKLLVAFCLLSILLTLSPGRTLAQSTLSPAEQSQSAFPAKEDQNKSPLEKAFERLEWRSIGPANMGGRVADVEGIAGDPNVVYIATASGGLWKTANGGFTWKSIFERQ